MHWSDVMTAAGIEDPNKLTLAIPPKGYRLLWNGETVPDGAIFWSERTCRWMPNTATGYEHKSVLDKRLVCRIVAVRIHP